MGLPMTESKICTDDPHRSCLLYFLIKVGASFPSCSYSSWSSSCSIQKHLSACHLTQHTFSRLKHVFHCNCRKKSSPDKRHIKMSAATANFINQAALNVGGAVTGLGHTVLISGVTGFVGTHVALEFAKRGFNVHATARSQDKANEWNKLHPVAAVRTKWFIVKDAITDGAFDEAVKGVDIVVHTASPFHYHAKDPEKDMLIPAINGTLSILKSAANEPSHKVKRMVITSSFAANLDFDKLGPNKTYTEADWNPATRESAIEKAESSPGYLYCMLR